MFDRAGNEADSPAGKDAGHSVANCGQLLSRQFIRVCASAEIGVGEDVVKKEFAVDGQATEHDGVAGHPSQERWGGALVDSSYAFFSNRL